MRFEARVDGRLVQVEVRRRGEDYTVTLDGRRLEVDAVLHDGGLASLLIEGRSHEVAVEPADEGFLVHFPGGSVRVGLVEASRAGAGPARRASGPAPLKAPMPGRVVRVLVAAGDAVVAGQGLVVVEAMKMENELRAPRAGRVEQVAVRDGQAVEAGALLLVVA